ncbi:Murein DD-endopeptidase MepH [Saezia sanguinis]|uniref:Murein DD-endopeptidase MepH n=1 Tax=Saezia sanguinis TaxID=1965230 RepID=A0A433SFZ3_9BURK|nr:Murein DD-endopeptidase MepH [Saezia sanguinis]
MMRSSSKFIVLLTSTLFTCSHAWADEEGDPIGRLLQVQALLNTPEPAQQEAPVEQIQVASLSISQDIDHLTAEKEISHVKAGTASTDPLATLIHTGNILTTDNTRQMIADSAFNYLNLPYRYGGNNVATGFDCSGLVRALYLQVAGKSLPRRTSEQAAATTKINRTQLQPGDLVFFNTNRRTYSHVGIYVGDNKFIHAPRTGSRIRIEDMTATYWNTRFTGARRVELR